MLNADTVKTEKQSNGTNGAAPGALETINPSPGLAAKQRADEEQAALAHDERALAARSQRVAIQARMDTMLAAGQAVNTVKAKLESDPVYALTLGERLLGKLFIKLASK